MPGGLIARGGVICQLIRYWPIWKLEARVYLPKYCRGGPLSRLGIYSSAHHSSPLDCEPSENGVLWVGTDVVLDEEIHRKMRFRPRLAPLVIQDSRIRLILSSPPLYSPPRRSSITTWTSQSGTKSFPSFVEPSHRSFSIPRLLLLAC
jgi:hypothetical protein